MKSTFVAAFTTACLASFAAFGDGALVVGCDDNGKLVYPFITNPSWRWAKQRAIDTCALDARSCPSGVVVPSGQWIALAVSSTAPAGSTCPVYALSAKGSQGEAEADAIARCQERGFQCAVVLSRQSD